MKRVAATSATAAAALALAGTLATAAAQDKITFATNWVAQAEHGGWYQALANSYYKDAGLDVTIRMGGPSVNTAQLLAGGAVDIAVGGNDLMLLNFVEGNIPMVAIAATYQKDPQCFIAHPGRFDSIAAMTDAEIQISADARATFWQFLKAEHGLSDNQVRPYNFDIRPFLVNQDVVQQCYATSSPHTARDGGIDPDVFMFSDYGWSSYSAILMAARQLVDDSPEIVQRFVDASAKGWYSYLYEDPAPGNALITAANPDMTQRISTAAWLRCGTSASSIPAKRSTWASARCPTRAGSRSSTSPSRPASTPATWTSSRPTRSSSSTTRPAWT